MPAIPYLTGRRHVPPNEPTSRQVLPAELYLASAFVTKTSRPNRSCFTTSMHAQSCRSAPIRTCMTSPYQSTSSTTSETTPAIPAIPAKHHVVAPCLPALRRTCHNPPSPHRHFCRHDAWPANPQRTVYVSRCLACLTDPYTSIPSSPRLPVLAFPYRAARSTRHLTSPAASHQTSAVDA